MEDIEYTEGIKEFITDAVTAASVRLVAEVCDPLAISRVDCYEEWMEQYADWSKLPPYMSRNDFDNLVGKLARKAFEDMNDFEKNGGIPHMFEECESFLDKLVIHNMED